MHYYQFNIGDYIKSTHHLDDKEDLIYRRLLDLAYTTENPLPKEPEKVARLIRLGYELEKTQAILEEFFTLTETGWIQKRIEAELKRYRSKARTARANGKAGGRPAGTQKKPSGFPEVTQKKAKHKPITNNHKPITNDTHTLDYSSWPSLPDPQILDDWVAMRKRMNAPISQTVINNFGAELRRASEYGYSVDYCMSEAITRNWRGLKVEWLKNATDKQYRVQRESKSERSDRIAREYLQSLSTDDDGNMAWIESDGSGTHRSG